MSTMPAWRASVASRSNSSLVSFTSSPALVTRRAARSILTGPAGPVRAEAIQQPVLLLHGADDHVAPLSDVTDLADALAALDKPHDLLILGTAGHEFGAKNDTVRALEAELAFYRDRLRVPAP